eukprot:609785-Rhodomonas_salina.1
MAEWNSTADDDDNDTELSSLDVGKVQCAVRFCAMRCAVLRSRLAARAGLPRPPGPLPGRQDRLFPRLPPGPRSRLP